MKLRWLAPLVVLSFAVAALLAAGNGPPGAAAEHYPVHDKHICLDPGHGGTAPGAVNGTLLEKDINLDEALYLRDQWEARGAIVTMTREGDETKSTRQRYELCNSVGADILVSVHTNSVSDPDPDGSLSLYFQDDDKVLAGAVHEVMYPALADGVPHTFTNFGLKKDALGVLLKSKMPSVMVEPVFMSHPWEADLLVTPIYLDNGVTLNSDCVDCRRVQIAQSIIDGVDIYFLNYAGQEPEGPGGGNGKGKKPR